MNEGTATVERLINLANAGYVVSLQPSRERQGVELAVQGKGVNATAYVSNGRLGDAYGDIVGLALDKLLLEASRLTERQGAT